MTASIALQSRSLHAAGVQASSHMQAVVWVKPDFYMLQQTHSGDENLMHSTCLHVGCKNDDFDSRFFCLGIANPCRVNCINGALVQTSMLVSNTCSIQAQSHFKHLNLRRSTMAKGQLLVRPLAFLNKLLRKPTQSEKKRWLPDKPCYWGKNVRRKFGEKLVQLECIIHILYFCIGSI